MYYWYAIGSLCTVCFYSDERVNYSRVPQDDPEMEPLMSSKTPVGGRNEEEDDEEMLNADPTTLKV